MNKYKVIISQDSGCYEDCYNPFYESENAGIIYNDYVKQKYGLEDTINREYFEEHKDDFIAFRVALTDHSSVSFHLKGDYFDRWDSADAGIIYIDRTNYENPIETARQLLDMLTKSYNGWLLEVSIYTQKICECCGQKIVEYEDGCSGFYTEEDALDFIKETLGDEPYDLDEDY